MTWGVRSFVLTAWARDGWLMSMGMRIDMVMQGETLATGAPDFCKRCQTFVSMSVMQSGAGWYIGSFCDCGPYSRESGYFSKKEEADKAFVTGDWEPRA